MDINVTVSNKFKEFIKKIDENVILENTIRFSMNPFPDTLENYSIGLLMNNSNVAPKLHAVLDKVFEPIYY